MKYTYTFFVFLKMYWLGREREKNTDLLFPFAHAFIGCLLHVPWQEMEAAKLDHALINWAALPGLTHTHTILVDYRLCWLSRKGKHKIFINTLTYVTATSVPVDQKPIYPVNKIQLGGTNKITQPRDRKLAGCRVPQSTGTSSLVRPQASLTGVAALGSASPAAQTHCFRLPPISTLDAFRSCVEQPGGRRSISVGQGCGVRSRSAQRRRGWRTRGCSAWPRSAAATAPWWTETSSTCGGATW